MVPLRKNRSTSILKEIEDFYKGLLLVFTSKDPNQKKCYRFDAGMYSNDPNSTSFDPKEI